MTGQVSAEKIEESTKQVRNTIHSSIMHSISSCTEDLEILVGKWKYRNIHALCDKCYNKGIYKVDEAKRRLGGGKIWVGVINCIMKSRH